MNTTQNIIDPEDYRRLVLPKLLLAAVIGAAVFSNSILAMLTPDDQATVTAITELQHSGAAPWLSSQRLLNATLLLNQAVAPQLVAYHIVNILLHLLAGLTLFGIVCRTMIRQQDRPRLQTAAPWLALLIVLLWMLHPLQTQSVTHISGRGTILAGLCFLLTLYGVIRAADAEWSLPWYGLAVLACALGMGSSPAMAVVPVTALLFDRIYLSGTFADLWRQRRAGLYAALAACWAILLLPFSTYVLTQPGVILHYLRLVIWPVGLSVDYSDYPAAQSFGAVLPGLAILLVLLAATGWALVRSPKYGFLGAWFLLTLLPSCLVPSAELVNESRMYLPLAAVSAGVVLAGFELALVLEKKYAWATLAFLAPAAILLGALGLATFLRNYDHAGPLELWQQTVSARPGNLRAQFYLGNALYQANRFADSAAHLEVVMKAPREDPIAQRAATPHDQPAGPGPARGRQARGGAATREGARSGPGRRRDAQQPRFSGVGQQGQPLGQPILRGSEQAPSGDGQVPLQPGPGTPAGRRQGAVGRRPRERIAPGPGLPQERPGPSLAEGDGCRPEPEELSPGPLPGRAGPPVQHGKSPARRIGPKRWTPWRPPTPATAATRRLSRPPGKPRPWPCRRRTIRWPQPSRNGSGSTNRISRITSRRNIDPKVIADLRFGRTVMPRKRSTLTLMGFKVDSELAELLNAMPNKSAFIRKAILAQLGLPCPMCSGKGFLSRRDHDWLAPQIARAPAGGLCRLWGPSRLAPRPRPPGLRRPRPSRTIPARWASLLPGVLRQSADL